MFSSLMPFLSDIRVGLPYLLGCAEILDEQVHQQDAGVHNGDEDGGVRAGDAVAALFGKLVDAGGT